MKGIIRVRNTQTDEIYIATTKNSDRYLEVLIRYPDGTTEPNKWMRQYGASGLEITELESMTDEEFANTAYVRLRRKEHIKQAVAEFGEKVIVGKEGRKASVKVDYNMYSRLEAKLDGITEILERVEGTINAKLGK